MKPQDRKRMEVLIKRLANSIIENRDSSLFEKWVRLELKHSYEMGFIAGVRRQLINSTNKI